MAKRLSNGKQTLPWGVALGLTLLQAIIWWFVTPPWTAPDEPGHYLYARLIAERGVIPDAVAPEQWHEVLVSMEQTGWRAYLHPNGDLVPDIAQEPVLAASGTQVGRKPPGYYALAALWLRALPDWPRLSPTVQMRWIRLLSPVFRLLTTATALHLATRLWPNEPGRILGLGLLVGLMPMVGFIGGSLNNDALTLLWGGVAFSALLLARSFREWTLALGLIIMGPLLVDVNLLYLWPLALWRWGFFRHEAGCLQVRTRASWRPALLVMGALALALMLSLFPNSHRAAGWRSRNTQQTRREGQLFLQAHTRPAVISQAISGKEILQRRGQTMTLEARISGHGEGLMLQMTDGRDEVETICPLASEPRLCYLTFPLTPESRHLTVSARLPAGAASLQLQLTDPAGWSLLSNGDGRLPASIGQALFIGMERHLPLPSGYFDRILSPAVWDAPSLLRYGIFAGFTWASFWGYFGWLSRPFPWPTYLLLVAVTLAALVGVARRLSHILREPTASEAGALIFSLGALALVLLQTWLPMLGQAWQPQGRYLFPALLPIAILLLLGWETALPRRFRHRLPWLLTLSLLLLNLQAWRLTLP